MMLLVNILLILDDALKQLEIVLFISWGRGKYDLFMVTKVSALTNFIIIVSTYI